MATFDIETSILKSHPEITIIVGMDEVGRGPLAGPVTVGAVAFEINDLTNLPNDLWNITDSKKLSKKKRTLFDQLICEHALFVKTGSSEADNIDNVGIIESLNKASDIAVLELIDEPFAVIADSKLGNRAPKGSQFRRYVQNGDSISLSIAAASIVAKVWRDNMMKKLAELDEYAPYGWEKNVGYGTKQHREAILKHGLTKHHRKSFCRNIMR